MYMFPHLREEEALANGGNSGNSTGSTPTGAKGGVDSRAIFGASKQGSTGGFSSGSAGRQGKPIKPNQNNDEPKKKATVAYMVVSNPLSHDSHTSQD